jgi:DNA-binding transcriptional regulator YbjK
MENATDADEAELVERLTQLVLTEADDRPRDRILLAELYVLSFRDERYAGLIREWMHRAHAAITRTLTTGNARAVDAAQEGLTLQRFSCATRSTRTWSARRSERSLQTRRTGSPRCSRSLTRGALAAAAQQVGTASTALSADQPYAMLLALI